MKIDLMELCNSSVLAGALKGRTVLSQLLANITKDPNEPETIFLDFSGVEVATASFLRESVLEFRDIVRRRRSHFYPVVANANEVIRDELKELLRLRRDVIMTCVVSDNSAVGKVSLMGELDPKQRLTFDLIQDHGETDAGTLMRKYGEEEGVKHPTAWNNRLASLASLGLVIEQSQGRAKRYRPLFGGT